jgi:hypothetical protein
MEGKEELTRTVIFKVKLSTNINLDIFYIWAKTLVNLFSMFSQDVTFLL